jgi:hypothetical protein
MPWVIGSKSFVRDNSRNVGPVVWTDDATAGQVIDSNGHDFHDQDIADGITECLNIDGINQMLANMDMGGLKVINLAPATLSGEAVDWDLFQTTAAQVITNTSDISDNTSDISDNTNAIIGKLSKDGSGGGMTAILDMGSNKIVNMDNGTGQFDAVTVDQLNDEVNNKTNYPLIIVDSLKSDGPIRQTLINELEGDAAIDVSLFNQFQITNIGALTITFSGYPSGTDPDIGDDYIVKGTINVINGPGGSPPGAIIIADIPGTNERTIGAPGTTASGLSILEYSFTWTLGALVVIYIWTAN